MGRPRLRLRGELHLSDQLLRAHRPTRSAHSIVNPPGDNPPSGHTHTYNVTLSGNASVQIKDVIDVARPRRLGDRQFPALCLRRRGDGPHGRDSLGHEFRNLQDDYDVTTQTIVGAQVISSTVHHTDFFALPTLGANEERTNSSWPARPAVSAWNTCCGIACSCAPNGNTSSSSAVKNTTVNTEQRARDRLQVLIRGPRCLDSG